MGNKTVMCAVRDTRVEVFGNPFFSRAPGQAMRDFMTRINTREEGNALNTNPEDFELWKLGTFDDETGEIQTEPERLMRGIDARQAE